jgi:hypothetical protein
VRTAICGLSGRSSQRRRPGSLGRRTRSHRRVPVRERSPGRLSNRHDVPSAGGLLQRPSCVGEAASVAGAETDAVLIAGIHAAHRASRGTYGAPRVHAELAARGIRVGCKRVARLMTRTCLAGVCRRRFVTTTVKDGGRQAPDLVERNFTAQAPDRLWVAGIPYIPTGQAFSTSRSCSIPSAVALSAGRWPRHSPDNWCSMP